MRGTPFIQAILVLAMFLLAGVPVYRLTRPAAPVALSNTPAPDPTAPDPAAKSTAVGIEVVCAPAPTDFQIKNLDQTLLAGRGPQARFTARWITALPAEGVDLVVMAHWPTSNPGDSAGGASPAAARVTVHLASGQQVEKSFWAGANGALEEVFTIPGENTASTP